MDQEEESGTTSGQETPDASAPAKEKGSLLPLVARDLAIALGLLSLFAAADAWSLLTGSGFAAVLSVLDGLLVGLAVGALAHEWGHYTGARWMGADLPLKSVRSFPQVFGFDYLKCEPSHFMGLSVGGNVGHWLVVLIIAVFVPLGTAGQVALLSGAVGFAVFGSTVEFPVIARARKGDSPLESLSVIHSNFVQRNGAMGLAAALLVFFIV